MSKLYLRAVIALALAGFFVSPALLTAAAGPADEQIVVTAVPENQLNLGTFTGTLIGLSPVMFNPQASARPSLGTTAGFWKTTENSLFITSLVSFAGLNVADYFLTREALKYPGAGETNPLLSPIVHNAALFALVKAGYIALNTVGGLSFHENDKPMAWAVSVATNLLAALAVSHNVSQIHKLKGS